jgi:hypothetical protein
MKALVGVDQLRHPRRQPSGEQLGDEPTKTVDEADWPEVFHLHRTIDLGEEGEEGKVEPTERLITTKEHRLEAIEDKGWHMYYRRTMISNIME